MLKEGLSMIPLLTYISFRRTVLLSGLSTALVVSKNSVHSAISSLDIFHCSFSTALLWAIAISGIEELFKPDSLSTAHLPG
jgi:hypothetical protein